MDLLGRYELLFEIGAGGMANVYVARMRGEAGFVKLVAIKRMLPSLTHDGEFIRMFLDEARLAANISSPHVVTTYELGRQENGTPFIVMELVVGTTLQHLFLNAKLRGEIVPIDIGIELLAQAALGLDDAHEATTPRGEPLGLVHRDVTPSNVLVGVDGLARISDFGVAFAGAQLQHTTPGYVKGKHSYYSPEQLKGEYIDRRSDVFALGIVAWEMLTGCRLFMADNPLTILDRILTMKIPSVREFRPEIPLALSNVVARALERDPNRRISRASLLAQAFRETASQTARPPPDRTVVANYVRKVGGESLWELQDKIRRLPTTLPPPAPSMKGAELQTEVHVPRKFDHVKVKEKPFDVPLTYELERLEGPRKAPRTRVLLGVLLWLSGGWLLTSRTRDPVRPRPTITHLSADRSSSRLSTGDSETALSSEPSRQLVVR